MHSIIKNAERGKEVELNLSFLKKDQNKLLTKYLNLKLKKKYFTEKLDEKSRILNDLKKKINKEKTIKLETEKERLEEEVKSLSENKDIYKFMNFSSYERKNLFLIRKKINKLIKNKTYIDNIRKELEQIEELMKYLKIFKTNKSK